MFESVSLESVIRDSGVLGTRPPTALGWYEVKCRVCSDYKVRAAFKFEPDGSAAYHCFNCGHISILKPDHTTFSKKMVTTLTAFGIDLHVANRALFTNFISPASKPVTQPLELRPAPERSLPATFFKLDPTKHLDAYQYVKKRGFELETEDWMVALPIDKVWKNRIIIPIKNQHGKLVFYQGRSYHNNNKRWESPNFMKTGVIYRHHKLYEPGESIVVCEGVFDALSVDGVALLGSEISEFQAMELKKFRGEKIFVPNKDSKGKQVAEQALKHGFSLSFPDIGSCLDLNDAYIKYGAMYLNHQIQTKIASGAVAQMKLSVWCSL